eukprot:5949984-Prymnesium_polylepis.2
MVLGTRTQAFRLSHSERFLFALSVRGSSECTRLLGRRNKVVTMTTPRTSAVADRGAIGAPACHVSLHLRSGWFKVSFFADVLI